MELPKEQTAQIVLCPYYDYGPIEFLSDTIIHICLGPLKRVIYLMSVCSKINTNKMHSCYLLSLAFLLVTQVATSYVTTVSVDPVTDLFQEDAMAHQDISVIINA